MSKLLKLLSKGGKVSIAVAVWVVMPISAAALLVGCTKYVFNLSKTLNPQIGSLALWRGIVWFMLADYAVAEYCAVKLGEIAGISEGKAAVIAPDCC